MAVSNTSVSGVRIESDRCVLTKLNGTGHLRNL
jgi:hypothetical protein